jgi:hypothetical protein
VPQKVSVSQQNEELTQDVRGMVLITSLIVFLIATFITLSLADLTITQYGRTVRNVSVSNSLLTAEAGAEESLYNLNEDDGFAGFAETELYNSEEQGRGTYQSTVTAGSGPNEKIVTSIGRVYAHNESTDPISERRVKITTVGTTSSGNSVHAGVGGLILSGSAAITNSSIYVNGTISLSGASKIGTAAQPLDVNVAHLSCPTGSSPGPTFPQVCSTGQPISMAFSTAIYGSVCATNQTSTGPNNNIKTGTGGQGLISNCTAPPVSVPTYDRAAHIAAVTTTGAGNNITYNCSQWQNPVGFVRTWPANLQLTGNVSASSSCDLTVTGNVHITGNLDIGGAARIRVANSVGTTRPVIMVDGTITVGGSAALIPNSSGTGIQFVSNRSTASCNPACTSVTGNDLKTSSTTTMINVAGAGNFPGAVFQSPWGRVVLGGSGTMGSAVGQTVDLSGAGTITFGTALSSGESTWTVRSYQQIFN